MKNSYENVRDPDNQNCNGKKKKRTKLENSYFPISKPTTMLQKPKTVCHWHKEDIQISETECRVQK